MRSRDFVDSRRRRRVVRTTHHNDDGGGDQKYVSYSHQSGACKQQTLEQCKHLHNANKHIWGSVMRSIWFCARAGEQVLNTKRWVDGIWAAIDSSFLAVWLWSLRYKLLKIMSNNPIIRIIHIDYHEMDKLLYLA